MLTGLSNHDLDPVERTSDLLNATHRLLDIIEEGCRRVCNLLSLPVGEGVDQAGRNALDSVLGMIPWDHLQNLGISNDRVGGTIRVFVPAVSRPDLDTLGHDSPDIVDLLHELISRKVTPIQRLGADRHRVDLIRETLGSSPNGFLASTVAEIGVRPAIQIGQHPARIETHKHSRI